MTDRARKAIAFVTILILILIGVYRLAQLGKLPFRLPEQDPSFLKPGETRRVVQEENSIISVVEKTSPSVVAIGVTQRVINPFNPFSRGTQNQNNTIGTGFVVDSDKGIIVTNRHVVSDTNLKYTVVTRDGKKLEVNKIYRDINLDLAILQVSGSVPQALELGDSSKLKVGQTAIAIGNALGRFSNTVTTGIVSGLGRAVNAGDPFSGQYEQLDNLIQTDAAINPGNSGGPLLNSAGQVVGVNVATTEGAQNIGFAIPINSIEPLIEDFKNTGGNIQRAFLGVRYFIVTRDRSVLSGVPQGAYVQEVISNSPADKADINPGDVITKIENQPVNDENKISSIIQTKKPGDKVNLEVWIEGNTKNITATLEQAPTE